MAGHAERLVLVEAGGLGLRFPVSVVREVALVEGFNSAGRAFGDASEGFARIRDELIPVLTVRDLLGLKTRDASQVYALVLRIEQRVTAVFIDRIVDVVASDGLQTDEVSALTPSATPDLAAQVSNFEGQPFLDITDAVLRRAVFVADHTAKKIERMTAQASECLLVERGGAKLAIPVSDVFATLPGVEIVPNTTAIHGSRGRVTYRGWTYCVCEPSVAMTGTVREASIEPASVVLVGPDAERCLALAVDRALDIRQLGPPALHASAASDGLSVDGIHVDEAEGLIFRLSANGMSKLDLMTQYARLTTRALDEETRNGVGAPPQQPYLIATSDRDWAIPLSAITAVTQGAQAFVPLSTRQNRLVGYCDFRGQPTPVYWPWRTAWDGEIAARVLIFISTPSGHFALVVETLKGLERGWSPEVIAGLSERLALFKEGARAWSCHALNMEALIALTGQPPSGAKAAQAA